jgi:hypothetical protein
MSRDEILQQAANAVATAWLEDERRDSPEKPTSDALWITATNIMAMFYCYGLEQYERHRVTFEMAPAALESLRAVA